MRTGDSKVTNLIKSESQRSLSHFKFKEGKDDSGYQSPTRRPRSGRWKQVNGGLLCRAKYGGGPVPPSRYGSPKGLLRPQKRLAIGTLIRLGGQITHEVDTKRLKKL